jgi:hypothetical protein
MASTIEKAKENDPAELRRELVQLRRDLALERNKKPAATAAAPAKTETVTKTERVEVPVIRPGEISKLERVLTKAAALTGTLDKHNELIADVRAGIAESANKVAEALARAQVSSGHRRTIEISRSALSGASSGNRSGASTPKVSGGAPVRAGSTLSGREAAAGRRESGASAPRAPRRRLGPQQAMLDALAWLESVGIAGAKWSILGFLSNQSPKSSGFEKNVSTLRSAGSSRATGRRSSSV